MVWSPDILERNLSALQARQSEVASLVRDCKLPDGLTSAVGRDGTPTLTLPGDHGPVWLGGSSMPRAGAEEMFGNFDPRGGSVTLPAMLTGMEAIVLAERLAPRFAVFVVDEPTGFKMALSLHDYRTFLQGGKIVLLLSDDVPARMCQFFAKNPGFALPAHVFKVPQVAAGHLANLARTLQDAGAQAMRIQHQFIMAQSNRLRAAHPRSLSSRPGVALLAADDFPETIEHAARIERACKGLAEACEVCLPVSPDRCLVAARVESVANSGADFAIFLNGVTTEERSLFPPQFPIAHWMSIAAFPRYAGGSFDVVIIESQSQFERARSAGWTPDRVHLCEPSADIVQNEIAREPISVDKNSPVVVMMDLPDDRPEAAGVTLPSHIALWQALQQEVLRRSDRYTAGDSGDVLRAAQQSSGTVLTDAALSASFEGRLHSHISPATVARSLALALVKSGFEPRVWGRHWPPLGRGQDLRQGPIPGGVELHRLLEQPAWLVLPWFSHKGVQLALDAMARGSVIIMRGSRDAFLAEYPGLAELAGDIHWFSAAGELVATVRRLISRHETAAENARMVARKIRAEHTLVSRLHGLIEVIRAFQRRRPPQENV